jgi:hypothetical protein
MGSALETARTCFLIHSDQLGYRSEGAHST